jgi:hypothetical protein
MSDTSPKTAIALADAERLQTILFAPRIHLAFVHAPILQKLRSGLKSCESRLSLRTHSASTARPGDVLWFKSGDVGAAAIIRAIDTYSSADPLDVDMLMARYSRVVDGPVCELDYWHSKREARHAVFLHLEDVAPLLIPRTLLPTTRAAWISDFKPDREVRKLLDEALALARQEQRRDDEQAHSATEPRRLR